MARISVLLPDLRAGGAERLHVHLAREWLRLGLDVEFVLRQARGELLGQIPDGARIVDLSASRVRQSIWPLCAYLRERQPQALLAAMWPLTVVAPLAARLGGFRGRIIVSEHAQQSLSYLRRGKGHNTLMVASMRALYPWADARIAVSEGVANDMARLSGLPRRDIEVVHNPAAVGKVLDKDACPLPIAMGDGPLILSVGTLKLVKRQDLLIRAFARLRLTNATLCIIGEGRERARLEALVETLGLQGRVLLPGYQADTAPWYAHADLFVLSSDHEGFGNVIVEALEQGTPVVSTDCPSGPREILDNGRYGALVPVGDVDALAKAMENSLAREHDHEALKRRACDFSVDKAAAAYLEVLLPGWRGQVIP